jgi:hypothetical protein
MKHLKLYEEFNERDLDEGLKDWLKRAGKFLVGLVAAPKFMEILGYVAGSIGKRTDSPEIKSVGDWLLKNGKELQDKYMTAVGDAIGPMLKDKSQKDTIAKELILAVSGNHAAQYGLSSAAQNIDTSTMVDKAKEIFSKHYK